MHGMIVHILLLCKGNCGVVSLERRDSVRLDNIGPVLWGMYNFYLVESWFLWLYCYLDSFPCLFGKGVFVLCQLCMVPRSMMSVIQAIK